MIYYSTKLDLIGILYKDPLGYSFEYDGGCFYFSYSLEEFQQIDNFIKIGKL